MFEGINVGFIGFLLIYVRIGDWGLLESLFYEFFEKKKKVWIWMFFLLLS